MRENSTLCWHSLRLFFPTACPFQDVFSGQKRAFVGHCGSQRFLQPVGIGSLLRLSTEYQRRTESTVWGRVDGTCPVGNCRRCSLCQHPQVSEWVCSGFVDAFYPCVMLFQTAFWPCHWGAHRGVHVLCSSWDGRAGLSCSRSGKMQERSFVWRQLSIRHMVASAAWFSKEAALWGRDFWATWWAAELAEWLMSLLQLRRSQCAVCSCLVLANSEISTSHLSEGIRVGHF